MQQTLLILVMNWLRALKSNSTLKRGTLYTLFSFCGSGINFILLIFLAKIVDPEGYGYINVFTTIITLLGFVINLNTSGVISVNYFKLHYSDYSKTVRAVINITYIVTLLLLGCVLLLPNSVIQLTKLTKILIIYAVLVSFSNTFFQIVLNIWRVEEKIIHYGLYSMLFAGLNFVFVVILVKDFQQNWVGYIYGLLLVNILFLLLSFIILTKKKLIVNIRPTKYHYNDCLKFGIPLIPHSTSVWLRQGLDRIFIGNFLTLDLVGFYGLALSFSNIIVIVASAFNNTLSVSIFKSLASMESDALTSLKKQTICILSIFFLFSTCVCVISILLIPIIFPRYIGCVSYMLPQCISAFFQCVYLQFVNYLFYFKQTKKLMYITFLVSCIHVLFSFILTRYNIIYTLWLGVLSQLCITLGVFMYSRKFIKIF